MMRPGSRGATSDTSSGADEAADLRDLFESLLWSHREYSWHVIKDLWVHGRNSFERNAERKPCGVEQPHQSVPRWTVVAQFGSRDLRLGCTRLVGELTLAQP